MKKRVTALLLAGLMMVMGTATSFADPSDVGSYSKKINGKNINVVVVNGNSKDLTFGIIKCND